MTYDIVLIDLSSIAYPIYMTSASEPDPNHASQTTVARVHALASGVERVAVCCDAGRSFRRDLDATYKATRPDRDAVLQHQIALAIEQLKADGFPVWAVPGFEADDLIATATREAMERDQSVLIVTGDKDLLQLVCPTVHVKSAADGSIRDEAATAVKFSVTPAQMRDFLTLTGDKSDNIAGADNIGPKKAADLLRRFGSLDALYEKLAANGPSLGLPPGMVASLTAFAAQMPKARALVTLRTDAPIAFGDLLTPRTVPPMASDDNTPDDPPEAEPAPSVPAQEPSAPPAASSVVVPGALAVRPVAPLVAKAPDVLAPAPAEWGKQLNPRSMREAQLLAEDMFKSRMFSAYGSPQAVLTTIMMGRELGLTAMASLRGIHNVEGRHGLSAQLMVALVLESGMAEYFLPVEISDTKCIYKTKRKGEPEPFTLTHTIEMARQAQLVKPNSNWDKNPTDMLVARCTSRLARIKYPDVLFGVYSIEELRDMRENGEAA